MWLGLKGFPTAEERLGSRGGEGRGEGAGRVVGREGIGLASVLRRIHAEAGLSVGI